MDLKTENLEKEHIWLLLSLHTKVQGEIGEENPLFQGVKKRKTLVSLLQFNLVGSLLDILCIGHINFSFFFRNLRGYENKIAK